MEERMKIIQGDITQITVDVIVNAANSSLLGGGGVDGAIHRAGGEDILAECRMIRAKQGSCATGEAVITTAGRLPVKYVIHTVGPVWNGGSKNEEQLLESCYNNSLLLAVKHNCETIAFPNISTGIYGYPKELAAKVAIRTVESFLQTNNGIKEVVFVCYDFENFSIYKKELKEM
ncbi:O-acetyl-ADP-ribose deacetylase (regulator of RNase III), contains Macro domain [Myroides marinus]|uniref:O-acetyl-ADP-ribose deacetylase (Regulator of RNase III), contains Macro domain n=1 Tax=Myroides marinus TaxID=703342 RepID=A0A1H6WR33_9FLAO|nr:O-acetyl-ADP-ribose deacetylase [Myroides marinus]MDM1351656.1 O-acetyl-ADP-ribose deacetylase [Myroides marinus]MDM1358863.1 O-acetyl-ADP-ribose deacetylase [Myroides marinus]MDM1376415.1 O-acetyl-ADP-ribose deacetylase [Myroides marinus]SEJ18246.1 O-acetyl-ADP-ribose deacetylase (regulator of RNase III), contains Macro domain [Myroides marinus]